VASHVTARPARSADADRLTQPPSATHEKTIERRRFNASDIAETQRAETTSRDGVE
jgi:hypothetical protein